MADEAPPVLSMHGRATAAAGAALVAAAVVNPLDVIKVRLDMVQAVAAMLHMTVCDSSMSVCTTTQPRTTCPATDANPGAGNGRGRGSTSRFRWIAAVPLRINAI